MKWPGHRLALGLFAGILCAWLLAMALLMRSAALPAEASGTMLVVFGTGMEETAIFAAITRANGRPVRATVFGFIWIVAGEEKGLAGRLAQEGAIGAYRELPISPTIAGCFALADATAANAF